MSRVVTSVAVSALGLPVFVLIARFLGGSTALLGSVFAEALWVSAWTSTVAMGLVLALGTPVAWHLSRSPRLGFGARLLVQLPIVLPPTVLGVALLDTFGRQGLLGGWIPLAFHPGGVVLVQVLVGLPLYVLLGTEVLRAIDDEMIFVARTLGADARSAWFRVVLPAAVPGLLGALALAWARSLGEFGATLVFAGNLAGHTQTLPLAIYTALEGDLELARALSVGLIAVAVLLFLALRALETR